MTHSLAERARANVMRGKRGVRLPLACRTTPPPLRQKPVRKMTIRRNGEGTLAKPRISTFAIMIKKRLQRLRGKNVRDLWQDRETRRIFGLIFAGKLLGIFTLLAAVKGVSWYFDSAAGATPLQDP